MGLTRLLELIFFVYFLTHIPITMFIDGQAVFPKSWYPEQIKDLLDWYCREFKDPMMVIHPAWYKSFIICEVLFQFPFFFAATYAFWKGTCRWIRVPAIVYSTHVATTVIPIIAHIMFYDFSESKNPGPRTTQERMTLSAIYFPYLLVPILILLTMLFNGAYQPTYTKVKRR